MARVADPASVPKPVEGGRCPVCNNGILFRIAATEAGEYLHCFNCGTSATVHTDDEWEPVVTHEDHTPTGFQLTVDQLQAKVDAGIDLSAPHRPAAGSTVAPAATADEPAPHEQHDQLPPADESTTGGNGGDDA